MEVNGTLDRASNNPCALSSDRSLWVDGGVAVALTIWSTGLTEKPMSGLIPVSKLAASIVLLLVIACSGRPTDAAELDDLPIPENVLIRLTDPLDDPDHYCVDVVGFGSAVRLQNPLQVHTCKPTDNRDQQFTFSSLNGQLYMEEYNLCVQPETLTRGSEIYLRDCSDIPEQNFDHLADGTLRLTGDGAISLCIAVAPGAGEIINPIHKRRDLILTACEGTEPSLIRWSFSPHAQTARVREASGG